MFHAVNRKQRNEQSAVGRGDRLRRLGTYTPGTLGTTAIFPSRETGEERENFPLQMEFILPEQFFGKLRAYETGERRLLAAVLEDAITCFQRFLFAAGQRQRRLYREAEHWIMERARPVESEGVCPYFSFDRVCDVLGLDADGVRDRLVLWREGQLANARAIATARTPWREPSATAARVQRSTVGRPQAA